MNNLKLYPYKMGSESGKDVARLLDIKRVKPDGKYRPQIGHTVINWGSSKTPNWLETANRRDVTVLNSVSSVKIASNKLRSLEVLDEAGLNIPHFTTDKRTARYWLEDGHTVVERHTLNGNSAAGVRIVNLDDPNMPSDLDDAPLYTKFIPKSREFRVHVFRGKVVDYAEKKKMRKERRPDNFNKYICSNEMGWVFCRLNIKHIDSVKEEAIAAVAALGLDFAAVDVVYHEGTPYILEANTAPGIMGTTLGRYVNTFREFMGAPNLKFDIDPTSERVEIINESSSLPNEDDIRQSGSSEGASEAVGLTSDSGMITLKLDRTTARKLKSLLAFVE